MASTFSESRPPAPQTPPTLDPWVERFEDAWRQGPGPVLDDFLPAVPAERFGVLVELVHIDLEYRLKTGETARVEDYLSRYPELASDRQTLLELLATEWRQRRRRENDLTFSAFVARFPQCRDEPALPWPALPNFSAGLGHLGRYELLEVAGRGGLGVVYRAWDSELRRTVAVKVPRFGTLLTSEETLRFLREVRGASRLRHPSIVAVHDAGQIEGLCYLVTDFVAGPTLAAELKARPYSPHQACELLIQVADALHYAHQEGVIHRDLKPSNILLDAQGRPHLTDFGLAKLTMEETSLTSEGQTLGTPGYMSPEQARGDSQHVDVRSDVYSLGVVLYELLTGQPPFRGTSGPQLLNQVVDEEAPPPRRVNAAVPHDLQSVCLKALAKVPAARYATAAELAEDLRRWLRGEPVRARPITAVGRLARWCRRRPALASLTAALLVAVASGLVGVTWQWRQAVDQQHLAEQRLAEAEQRREQLRKNFDLANHSFNQLIRDIELRPFPGQYDLERKEWLDGVRAYYQTWIEQSRDGSLGAEELALAYFCLADTNLVAGATAEAWAAARKALDLLRSLLQAESSNINVQARLTDTLLLLGSMHVLAHEYADASPYLEEARQLSGQLIASSPNDARFNHQLSSCYWLLGEIDRNTNRPRKALDYFLRARAIWEGPNVKKLPSRQQQRQSANVAYYLADLNRQLGDPKAAFDACAEARELLEPLIRERPGLRGGEDILARVYYLEGRLYDHTDHTAAALISYQKAAEHFERLVHHHPESSSFARDLAASHHNIGNRRMELKRSTDAVSAYQRALALREKLCRDYPDDPRHRSDYSGTRYRLGIALEQLSRREEALAAYQKAVELQRQVVAILPQDEQQRRYFDERLRRRAELLRSLGRPVQVD